MRSQRTFRKLSTAYTVAQSGFTQQLGAKGERASKRTPTDDRGTMESDHAAKRTDCSLVFRLVRSRDTFPVIHYEACNGMVI